MTDMNIQHKLEEIPADRRLIDMLYDQQKISKEARECALNLLYPRTQWGLWLSRLLFIIGIALILSGVVYFFAFNWAKMTPAVKISLIEISIITCLIGAYVRSLQHLSGQMLLLCASTLVGVFIAVFGQIYQTGANTYQLFMAWTFLTLGWTLISNFPAQWIGWLLVTNTFLYLLWKQAVFPTEPMQYLIFSYMAILNGSVLVLREYFITQKRYEWLKPRWLRLTLLIPTLLIMLLPIAIWINGPIIPSTSIVIGLAVSLMGHTIAYYFYRYRLQDVPALSATVISLCIMTEGIAFKIVKYILRNQKEFIPFLFMGVATLCIFTYGIIYLRKSIKKMEANHE